MKCEKCGHNLRVYRLGRRDCTCECHDNERDYKPTPKVQPLEFKHVSKIQGSRYARSYKHSGTD